MVHEHHLSLILLFLFSTVQVNITGPRATFELILLLLLYESAHVSPGVCILSCDSNAGEGWKLKVQTTTFHRRSSSSVPRNSHLTEEREGNQMAQRRAPRVISQSWLWAKSLLDAQSSEKRWAHSSFPFLRSFGLSALPRLI